MLQQVQKIIFQKLIEKKTLIVTSEFLYQILELPELRPVLHFANPEETEPTDERLCLESFTLFIEGKSSPYLEDAEINYDADNFGGQLTIKAPSSRIPKVGEDATIEDRVNYIIYSEINLSLPLTEERCI